MLKATVEDKGEVEEVKEEVIEEEDLEAHKKNVPFRPPRLAAQEPIVHIIINLALNGLDLLQISSNNNHTYLNLRILEIQRQ